MDIIKRFKTRDKSQNIIFVIYFVIFLVYSFISIYPIVWCLFNSMKSLEEYWENTTSLPNSFSLKNFLNVFSEFEVAGSGFYKMLWNSIWESVVSCSLNVLASFLVAYPLSRYKFPLKKLFYGIIIFRITIPIIGSAAAEYKMFRLFNMIDNPKLFFMAWLSGFDMTALIIYGYLKSISKSYSEAAYIDGASNLKTMIYVILPQAVPCITALFLNQLIVKWNDYTTPQLYLRSYPNLAYGVYEFDNISLFLEGGKPIFFAAVIIAAIPPVILYAFSQKLILKNLSVGGIKG